MSKLQEISYQSFTCQMDTAEVMKHNTLMNGITSTRGEAMGFIQTDVLKLGQDGGFELLKELKTTKSNAQIEEPVRVSFIFTGTYQRQENSVRLSAAQKGTGSVNWGTFSNFLDTGDGEFDSKEAPGILSLYPTAFFVENCKNVPMTVHLEPQNKTFTFELFEPVIISPEESKQMPKKKQPLDSKSGLMEAAPLEDVSGISLKKFFAAQGMRVGTCINPDYLCEPYASLVAEQFNSVTLENHLKPTAILDQEKSRKTGHLSVNFSPETMALLNWCKEKELPVRGHTLIWYMGTPEWIYHEGFLDDAPNVGREEMLRRMEDYIRGFFQELKAGGWSESLYCLDVVNEAVIAPDSLRKFPWQEIIGDDYLWHAYHFARKYAPQHIRLVYNDFDLEAKTDKVIALVNSLMDEEGSSLVDIVGQQGHYGAYSSIDTLLESLEKIGTETGREIQVTELDVSVSRKGTLKELKLQGRFYYNFVQQILKLRQKGVNVTGLTLWGFADTLSWMPSGHLHLYDRNLVPKYAYFGMVGMKEYAGFDDDDIEMNRAANCQARFAAAGDSSRFVFLKEDGTFLDTTTGTEMQGTYVFDGDFTYMLIPKVGGYINFHLAKGGDSAERVEAAGARLQMVRVK